MSEHLKTLIIDAVDDIKAVNTLTFSVTNLVGYTDWIIITTGTSNRHVKTIADKAIEKARELGYRTLGIEGEQESEWILVDFGDAILHVMTAEKRDFYQLEKLFI